MNPRCSAWRWWGSLAVIAAASGCATAARSPIDAREPDEPPPLGTDAAPGPGPRATPPDAGRPATSPDAGAPGDAHRAPNNDAAGGCKPDGRTCSGDVPQICVNGRWRDDARCPASAPMCRNGACVARQIVSAGDTHTCAVSGTGQLKCWGDNSAGALGIGDTRDRGCMPGEMGAALPLVDLGAGRSVVAASACTGWTCAIVDGGRIKCWGRNDYGQLGLGDTRTRGGSPGDMGDALPFVDLGTNRTARAVACGHDTTCALLDGGGVKCWGRNDVGQLGLGDLLDRGDEPGEMGDALPAVDLGSGRTAVAVSLGPSATCALLDNAQIKCWGANADGSLGLGDMIHGDESTAMGDSLPAVDLGSDRTALAISSGGIAHVCALLDDHEVKCWGWNDVGQLGLGDTVNRGDGPNQMGDSLPFVDLGQGQTATAASTAAVISCGILEPGNVKCWGSGILGTPPRGAVGDQPGEMGDALPFVSLGSGAAAVAISTGGYIGHMCVVLETGAVKCWGANYNCELGLGNDGAPRGLNVDEMGDNLPAVSIF